MLFDRSNDLLRRKINRMSFTEYADKAILKDFLKKKKKHNWDAHSFPTITKKKKKKFHPTQNLKITWNFQTCPATC